MTASDLRLWTGAFRSMPVTRRPGPADTDLTPTEVDILCGAIGGGTVTEAAQPLTLDELHEGDVHGPVRGQANR